MSSLSLIRERRAELRKHFDVVRQFEELEESCVPSYVHANGLASAVAWWRLVTAARLARKWCPAGPSLDFGSATGELWHLLGCPPDNDFVEENDILAAALKHWNPRANRMNLDDLAGQHYAAIFALDSLEHNDDVDGLLLRLSQSMRRDGVYILSGPTETFLYRLGRRLAGFDGHYHKTTIYNIENLARKYFRLIEKRSIPVPGIAPLFNISAWTLLN